MKTWSDESASSFAVGTAAVVIEGATSLVFALDRCYPNPFNTLVILKYTIAQRCPVELTIYDVTGRSVKTLVDGERGPGEYVASWRGDSDSGRQAASGIYFGFLKAGKDRDVKKLVLIR